MEYPVHMYHFQEEYKWKSLKNDQKDAWINNEEIDWLIASLKLKEVLQIAQFSFNETEFIQIVKQN